MHANCKLSTFLSLSVKYVLSHWSNNDMTTLNGEGIQITKIY